MKINDSIEYNYFYKIMQLNSKELSANKWYKCESDIKPIFSYWENDVKVYKLQENTITVSSMFITIFYSQGEMYNNDFPVSFIII